MSDRPSVPVTVQWARLGGPNVTGRRLLDCSNGAIGAATFRQLLARYSPGTLMPGDLPQVTISWFEEEKKSGHYVALGIHHQVGDSAGDAAGRDAMVTSYFCVPFNELADGSVFYSGMYARLNAINLPLYPPDPIRVSLPAGLPEAADDDPRRRLAMRVAALLLTTEPVCVLGAHDVAMAERLRFIDSVASFLPYGMRSRLSASTLASSTYRTHKFRLFFASDDRRAGDRLVTWGQLDDQPIGDSYADTYLGLLTSDEMTPVMLADQVTPMAFDRKAILQELERLRSRRPRPGWLVAATRLSPQAQEPAITAGTRIPPRPTAVPPPSAPVLPPDLGDVRELLASCAISLNTGDTALLRSAMQELRQVSHLGTEVTPDFVSQRGLLAPHPGIDETLLREFYVTLLSRVFHAPLDYARYCQVESSAGYPAGERLHAPLALALLEVGVSGPARLVLLNSLGEPEVRSALLSQPVSPTESAAMMVDGALAPPHARIVRDVAVRNLARSTASSATDRAEFIRAVEHHGVIVALLKQHAGEAEFLLSLLTGLLMFGYGGAMDGRAVRRTLRGVPVRYAAPLLGAMLRAVRPEDTISMTRVFVTFFLAGAGFGDETMKGFSDLLAARFEPAPAPSANVVPASRPRPARRPGRRDRSWALGLVVLALFVLSVIGLVNFFVQVLS